MATKERRSSSNKSSEEEAWSMSSSCSSILGSYFRMELQAYRKAVDFHSKTPTRIHGQDPF